MTLLDIMADAIREYRTAFVELNNNEDPLRNEALNRKILEAHHKLKHVLELYDSGLTEVCYGCGRSCTNYYSSKVDSEEYYWCWDCVG